MPFYTKRFLKEEVTRLTYRVSELEERLCPCESHDWKQIGLRIEMVSQWELKTIRDYKCKRCGRKVREYE